MIYICIPSHNEAATVGLVLWKIRKVFEGLGREYQILVVNDGSTDLTTEVLEPYNKVLPLTVIEQRERQGYARSVEVLLTEALARSDRPKRDCAVLIHADFAHGPEFIPDFIRRIESGADVVVGQAPPSKEMPRGYRMVRRWASWLLGKGNRVAGVRDPVSGFAAFRLITLRNIFKGSGSPALKNDGWAANAELLARAAGQARRVETVEIVERHDLKQRPSRVDPWTMAKALWHAGPAQRQESEEGAIR
ncbi:MAG: glycosyltransferase family 2 protein [Gemmatimonadota bacterium]